MIEDTHKIYSTCLSINLCDLFRRLTVLIYHLGAIADLLL